MNRLKRKKMMIDEGMALYFMELTIIIAFAGSLALIIWACVNIAEMIRRWIDERNDRSM